MKYKELDFWACAGEILYRLRSENGGVICTVVDSDGQQNAITLGWGQIGPNYRGHPIFTIAVAPPRHSWRFLEDVPEFVIAVPNDDVRPAVDFCGTRSGRDFPDKFAAAGITPVPSRQVRAPSVLECPINVECRIYTSVAPPHLLLTPEHREKPLGEQHTIYFAEVLGAYRYQ